MRHELVYFCQRNRISKKNIDLLLSKMGIRDTDIFIPLNQIMYGNEVTEGEWIRSFNKELKNNQNIYLPKYMIFFHGAAKSDVKDIYQNGLKPTSATRRKSYQSTPGYVYLANNRDRAQLFGDLGNGSNAGVFAVLVKTTDIKADLDQLRNVIAYNTYPDRVIKQTIGDSIFYGGGVRVKGSIPPYQIVYLG